MQKLKIARNENEYKLTELLDDKSLNAINRISKILNGTQYSRPKQLRKRDRTFNFFKKLMEQRKGVEL